MGVNPNRWNMGIAHPRPTLVPEDSVDAQNIRISRGIPLELNFINKLLIFATNVFGSYIIYSTLLFLINRIASYELNNILDIHKAREHLVSYEAVVDALRSLGILKSQQKNHLIFQIDGMIEIIDNQALRFQTPESRTANQSDNIVLPTVNIPKVSDNKNNRRTFVNDITT